MFSNTVFAFFMALRYTAFASSTVEMAAEELKGMNESPNRWMAHSDQMLEICTS